MSEPTKYNYNGIEIAHWDIQYEPDFASSSNTRSAAKWAVKCLRELAMVFCWLKCDRTRCNIVEKEHDQPDILDKPTVGSWIEAQKYFHDAIKYLPALKRKSPGCPACDVVKAFSCFPQLCHFSPVSPVATIKMDGVDSCSGEAYLGEIQERSIPCVIIDTIVGNGDHEIKSFLREEALLNIDIDELPPIPPEVLSQIEEDLINGRNIVAKLFRKSGFSIDNHLDPPGYKRVIEAPKSVQDALDTVLFFLEKHRLLFLWVASPCRINPLALCSKTGTHEGIDEKDIGGWENLNDEIDNEGRFLFRHRNVLDNKAQLAFSTFGPCDGLRPTTIQENESGDIADVAVEGGTFPYWTVDEIVCRFLEDSSDDLLKACTQLAIFISSHDVGQLNREILDIVHDNKQSKWYSSVAIQWNYLTKLDQAISAVKSFKINLSDIEKGPAVEEIEAAILVAIGLRDLFRIRHYYPGAIELVDFNTILNSLLQQLDDILSNKRFSKIKAFYNPPNPTKDIIHVEAEYAVFNAALYFNHPDHPTGGISQELISDNMNNILLHAQQNAPEAVNCHMRRMQEIMIFNCVYPEPNNDKTYIDRRRYIDMGSRYWRMLSQIIQNETHSYLHASPHPLTAYVINLQKRVKYCFSRVSDFPELPGILDIIDELSNLVIEGDPDDLSAVPERVSEQIKKVFTCIERIRQTLGQKTYEILDAERLCLETTQMAIDSHQQYIKSKWSNILKNTAPASVKDTKEDEISRIYPTPKGSSWSDVEIWFKDGHTISVKIGNEKKRVLNYTQLGMDDKRNRNPTLQWKLLNAFAENRGVLSWENSEADPRNQKRREKLAKDFQKIFGINGDPIKWDNEKKCWTTLFTVHPEGEE